MKNALRWTITALGISCLVFFLGMFFGRRSMKLPSNSPTVYYTEETTDKITQVNINNADLDQLQRLPGVGEKLAQRIIDYREANGPFTNILQLKFVDGIGDAKMEALIPYLCLEDTK